METFITDEGLQPEVSSILQTVFLSCDQNNKGRLKVSELMQFLKEKASSSEIFVFLDQLKKILDFEDKDPTISWAQCESGMQKWIRYINNNKNRYTQQEFNSNVRCSSSPRPDVKLKKYTSLPPGDKKTEKSITKKKLTTSYSNDSVDIPDFPWDCNDVKSCIEDLEITNRHLVGENTKLREQLNITEDVNTSMLSENDELQKQVKKYQKVIDCNKNELNHFNELKELNTEHMNIIEELQNKAIQYEKENHMLQSFNECCKSKISQMDVNFELLLEEKNKLSDELFKERASKSDYMSKIITELSLANEVLRAEKSTAEKELTEIRQEVLHGYSTMDNIAVERGYPTVFASPFFNTGSKSLCQELKAEMCSFNSQDGMQLDSSTGIRKEYLSIIHEFRQQFCEKKEMVVVKMNHLINSQQSADIGEHILHIVNDLDNQIELFTEKIVDLAQENQPAEKRILELAEALKILEEEKVQMNESREKALLKLDNLSICSIENQEKLSKLRSELNKEKQLLDETATENVKLKVSHDIEVKELHEKLNLMNERLSKTETCSDSVTGDLKMLVEDLECRNLEMSKKLFDFEELITLKEEEVLNEKENVKEKENILLSTKSKHERELQCILQAIPFDGSCNLNNLAITVDNVVDTLKQFLEKCEHENNRSKGMRDSPDGRSCPIETPNLYDQVDQSHQMILKADSFKDEKFVQSEVTLKDIIDEESPVYENDVGVNNSVQSTALCSKELTDTVNDAKGNLDLNIHTAEFSKGNNIRRKVGTFVPSDIINNGESVKDLTGILNTDNEEKRINIFPKTSYKTDDTENNAIAVDIDPQLVEKYRRFLISFQADQYTLPRRLENQQRSRDAAESCCEKQLYKLSNILQDIEHSQNASLNFCENVRSLHEQLDVLNKSVKKVSQQSEQHGCYQQENRIGPNIEMVILYVDQLRNSITKMEEELEVAKENLNNRKEEYIKCNHTVISETFRRNIQIPYHSDEKLADEGETGRAMTLSLRDISDVIITKNNNKKENSISSSEREIKSVTFSDVTPEEEIYSPSDPIVKHSTFKFCRMIFTPSKVINKCFLSFVIICVLAYIVWLGLEVHKTRLRDVFLQYLPFEVTHPKHEKR